jgi:DNA-directed RNA polymerase
LTTFEEVGAQYKLEREQIRLGLEKLHNTTNKLEDRSYASASIYGVASIRELLPGVVARIQSTTNRVKEGKIGVAFKEIHQFLAEIDAESVAAIGCKVTIDKVFSSKQHSNLIQNVTDGIGQAIENEAMMRFYESNVPGLLHTLQERYWHKSIGTAQKVTVIKTLMNRYDVQNWQPWGRANRVKLGGWVLDCICESSQWFMLEMRQRGRKRENYVVPTPEFMSIKDSVMETAELFSPLAFPMLVTPNDWQPDGTGGGYLLNELMVGYPMVRRGDPGCIQGKIPIAALNRVQKVAFTLNKFTVGVAEILQEQRIEVDKFIPVIEVPTPPKPPDIAYNKESRKDYRRRAAEAMNINAQAFKRSCRTRMTMNAVNVFKDVPKFYIPWSYDYRGRFFPIPSLLTPQDTDFGKSLLLFHSQASMTPEAEEWLAWQVCTTYGQGNDKLPNDERLAWTKANHSLITKIAVDPIGNLSSWEVADDPWQFLAACHEFYHTTIICDKQYTNLPVAVDASCSGLQVLAGLARDYSTAKLVNVVPSDKPQDAYKVVAEASIDSIPERIKPFWDRKCTKRTCLTIPYNAKPYSNRSYIRAALQEKGIEIEKDELTEAVKAVRKAMNEVVPGPMRVMEWIEKEVGNALKRGLKQIRWVTPTGFVVTQKLMKKDVKRIELRLLGTCEINVAVGDTKDVDVKHHKSATSPNLIHSLDASIVCLTCLRFNAPIALIHDSVLCRATDMSLLNSLVRETYKHLFADQDYLTNWAEQIGAETKPPIIGSLNAESVIESTYFFN